MGGEDLDLSESERLDLRQLDRLVLFQHFDDLIRLIAGQRREVRAHFIRAVRSLQVRAALIARIGDRGLICEFLQADDDPEWLEIVLNTWPILVSYPEVKSRLVGSGRQAAVIRALIRVRRLLPSWSAEVVSMLSSTTLSAVDSVADLVRQDDDEGYFQLLSGVDESTRTGLINVLSTAHLDFRLRLLLRLRRERAGTSSSLWRQLLRDIPATSLAAWLEHLHHNEPGILKGNLKLLRTSAIEAASPGALLILASTAGDAVLLEQALGTLSRPGAAKETSWEHLTSLIGAARARGVGPDVISQWLEDVEPKVLATLAVRSSAEHREVFQRLLERCPRWLGSLTTPHDRLLFGWLVDSVRSGAVSAADAVRQLVACPPDRVERLVLDYVETGSIGALVCILHSLPLRVAFRLLNLAARAGEQVHVDEQPELRPILRAYAELTTSEAQSCAVARLRAFHELFQADVIQQAAETQPIESHGVLPPCDVADSGVRYCEGRPWKDSVWCPRMRSTCCTRQKGGPAWISADRSLPAQSWTLLEVLEHGGLSLAAAEAIPELRNSSEYVPRVCGWLNRLEELRERLRCRACGQSMCPRFGWARKLDAVYNVTVLTCAAGAGHDQGVYLSHCWACRAIIDSRDSKVRVEGYYLCLSCGSGPQSSSTFTAGSLCPSCGSDKGMATTAGSDRRCGECYHVLRLIATHTERAKPD